MDDFDGTTRGFEHFGRTPLYRHLRDDSEIVDEVRIGFYRDDATTAGQFILEWPRTSPFPRLRAYSDGWPAMARCQDVLERLVALQAECPLLAPTPRAVCNLLMAMGLKDCTRLDPYA